jgi:uncharacterized repeat protein (TIGR01451 family)
MAKRSCRTKFSRTLFPVLLAVVVVAGLFLEAQPASAVDNGPTEVGSICMQKVFGTPVTQSNELNCTAGDIRLSRAISVSPASCNQGETFTLTATFETIVQANARYDAGFFFRIDGGLNARGDGANATGTCSLSGLTPSISPAQNIDGDTCGDLNAGTHNLTFTIPNVLCADPDGDGFLNLPNCTSWHNNQGTACSISGTNLSEFNFKPDTKSKCNCDDTFQVPVIVETAQLNVVKTASPETVPEPGGTVTYTVQITNNAQSVSVTINTIIDDLYGDVGDATNTNVTNNTCPTKIGVVLGPGGSTSCTFDALVSGDNGDVITDTVEVCGTDSANHNVCDDDDAVVTITDVSVAPTVQKTAQSSANCQLDVTYQVTVSNNSAIDTLTVNSLMDDKFGDITTAHAAGGGFAAVVTACTLSQNPIPASGNANCTFVGRITSTSCNINHTNTVTADVTDDDGVNSTPTDDATVTEVVTPPTP